MNIKSINISVILYIKLEQYNEYKNHEYKCDNDILR